PHGSCDNGGAFPSLNATHGAHAHRFQRRVIQLASIVLSHPPSESHQDSPCQQKYATTYGPINRPDLLYLSTSDYVQHKHAPGELEADAYHHAVDAIVDKLIALGATVAITADHGMNDKSGGDGAPNVIYLEDELTSRFGAGTVRAICPIADP